MLEIVFNKFFPIDLILKLLSSDGDVANQATKDIEDVMKDVKDIANSYKKAGVTNAE